MGGTMRHSIRPRVGVVSTFLVPALAIASAACAARATTHRVDVGGYKLRLRCAGRGSPVVVMDAGLGNTLDTWGEVAPKVASFTRVCTYDRAGLGRSAPGPAPRTSLQIVTELETLLANARVDGPYVLVGHSFGGMNARLFAARFPEQTAGMVLVEATHEDYPARERTIMSREERTRLKSASSVAPPAAKSEFDSILESAAQVRAAGPPPDVPVVVITAAKHDWPPELNTLWMGLQDDLVHRAPRGRQIVAQKSGHNVQFEQPEIVVEAIRSLVEEARVPRGAAASKGSRR